jgi:uncharacterized protein YegL
MLKKSWSSVVSLIACLILLLTVMMISVQSQSSIARVIITDIVAETREGKHPLVKAYLSVMDDQNQHVPGLGSSDFVVKEFTTAISDFSVSPERQGVAVDLLVDVSGSMGSTGISDTKLEDVQMAINQFIDSMTGRDLAGIFTFCKEVEQIQPLGRAEEMDVPEFMIPTDPTLQYTCLYDSVWEAIENLTSGDEEQNPEFIRMKKAIFVFSDGKDSTLSQCRYQLTDVKKLLLARDPQSKISIYAVGVGPEEGDNFRDLMNLADITEGAFIHYYGDAAQTDLSAAFERFLSQGEQYVISYGTQACEEQVTVRVETGGKTAEAEVTVEPVDPVINLGGVESDQVISGAATLTPEFVLAQCSIVDVIYYVNGVQAVTVGASPFSWQWDTSQLVSNHNPSSVELQSDGSGLIKDITVQARACDQKNRCATDELSGLTVKILPPEVRIERLEVLPSGSEVYLDNTHIERSGVWPTKLEETKPNILRVEPDVSWSGTARDIKQVEYILDGEQVDATDRLEPREIDISGLGSLEERTTHTLVVRVTDSVGMFAETEVPLTITVDRKNFLQMVGGALLGNVVGLIGTIIALVTLVLFLRSPQRTAEAVVGGVRKVTEFLGVVSKGTRLVMLEEGKDKRTYAVHDRLRIGRDATQVDIAFDDTRISRWHATLVKEDGDFLIYDHGSKNGTWINEMRVPFNGSSVLENGDVIELGRGGVQLRFEREESENENGG